MTMTADAERGLSIKGKVGLVSICTAIITGSLCGYVMHRKLWFA